MTVAVVGLALLATVLLLRQVLLNDLDDRIDRSLAQEAQEFAESVGALGPEPDETARSFARRSIENYLLTNVPSDDEVMLGAVGGRVFAQSRGAPADIAQIVTPFAGVSVPTEAAVSSSAGDVRLLAQPIVSADRPVGALIIGFFVDAEREAVNRTIRDAALVAGAALLAATALAWIVAGRVLRPIRLVAATARDITERDISRRIPEQGSDEIASLIESFNAMLDRLQAGVETQRRFLDDAGHELRTPLTILRGQIEVAAHDPAGLGDSAPTVLAELDRMGRIVDDLLTMARAEHGEFLRRSPIDLDEFVTGLLPLVEALGDQNWVIDSVPVGVAHADRDRLTQAMLNLAVNAERHTPDGGLIAIGGSVDGEMVSLWVADTGDGIEPDEQSRIFERFHRSAGGANGGAAGGAAGLGLSIVATIAAAHGGSVTVDSAPGQGSAFTITFPRQPSPPTDGRADDGGRADEDGARWPAS